jgi:hypothetical protein
MGFTFRMSDVLRKQDQHWSTLFQAGYQPPSHHGKLEGRCQFTDDSLHGQELSAQAGTLRHLVGEFAIGDAHGAK